MFKLWNGGEMMTTMTREQAESKMREHVAKEREADAKVPADRKNFRRYIAAQFRRRRNCRL